MRSLAMRHALPLIVALVRTSLAAQTPPPSQPILVKAGRLIDGRSDVARSNVGILIAGDRIKAVGPLAQVQPQAGGGARVIDLAQMTVLPGLIDTHTHLLLQGDPTADSYNVQLLYESTAYRAILAARSAVARRTWAIRIAGTRSRPLGPRPRGNPRAGGGPA